MKRQGRFSGPVGGIAGLEPAQRTGPRSPIQQRLARCRAVWAGWAGLQQKGGAQ